MRELTDHKINGCNEAISVRAMDEPGHGGACHEYAIEWQEKDGNIDYIGIDFQNGPIKEAGTNGITHEVLLAILMHRLRGFQSGPYACQENQNALEHIELAMTELKARTEKRLARGVEGTHTV